MTDKTDALSEDPWDLLNRKLAEGRAESAARFTHFWGKKIEDLLKDQPEKQAGRNAK
jgi:hypothetical protein